MPTAFLRVREVWLSNGVRFRPGLSWGEIEAWEAANGVRLPDDVRDYHSTVDGMAAGEMEGECFTFWPLSEVQSLAGEWGSPPSSLPHPERYFVFGEWLIGSHHYAFHVPDDAGSPGHVIWLASEEFGPAAGSYTEFFIRYLASPESMVFPKGS